MKMKISLDANIAGKDREKLFGLCEGLKIHNVVLPLPDLYEPDQDIVSESLLKENVRILKEGGLNVPVAMFPLFPSGVFLGEMPEKITGLCESLQIVADANIRTAVIFPWPESSDDPQENNRRWDKFLDVYSRVVRTAEEAGIRIATHGHRIKKILLSDFHSYQKLFKAIPSAANGLTFCMGCLHFTGDDFEKCIEELAERIFLVHVRDLKIKGEEIEELPLGEGEVNISGAFKALKKIEYDGLLAIEHIPSIPWEGNRDLLAHVQAVGFIKAMLSRHCSYPL
ncbi:MAG: TIM barrel protein [Nitrospirae bacterium]|nr:TIM barrel protein [Nitrospirota bacterium]